jgi:hypothetical protein
VQIDADGQHDVSQLPELLAAAQRHPDSVVTGVSVYDDRAPRIRIYGRYLTHFWVWVNTWSFQIRDSMCGFRVYPLVAALRHRPRASRDWRMEFDTEILVRMFWDGVPVVNIPTRVTYPADGISHFRVVRDNWRITVMHARLFVGMLRRLPHQFCHRVQSS